MPCAFLDCNLLHFHHNQRQIPASEYERMGHGIITSIYLHSFCAIHTELGTKVDRQSGL
jgi:hypothetical protein